MFPQAIGMAESWDPEAIRLVGSVESYEARYIYQSDKYKRGGLVIRAPNADLGRDPRWGRTEECYGEDPYFNGTMVVAMARGLEGDDPHYWRTAPLLKHFLANSNEDKRESSSSDFDDRLLREYYSVPFRMGIVDGHARAYMAAYNAVNRVPCTTNPILKEITIKEWGQDGIICTDAGGMKRMVTDHKYYSDDAHAAAGSIKAGITQFLDRFREGTSDALKQNLLTELDIDEAVKANFRVMIRLGLLDPASRVPFSAINGGEDPWLTEKHKSIARQVTRESIVLLKNQGGLLPLNKTALKSVAVIGPRAGDVLLDWYSGTPPYTVTPLEGIRNKLGQSVQVNYAAGDDPAAAIKAARVSGVVIACVGNDPVCEGATWGKCPIPSEGREAVDRRSISLEQEDLIKQVYKANPRTIVVLLSSFPYAINWTEQNVPAILHMTHCSQEEGNALADLLFGDFNPAGRLVQTWPASIDQLPPMMDYDIRHGRTYMYFKGTPLYPFGYGLSYTAFRYSNLRTSTSALKKDGSLTISVDVKNTGSRTGDEVVQLYVKHLHSSVPRPVAELKGFKRLGIEPGQTKTVTMKIAAADLAYWDVTDKRFEVETDKLRIMVGQSSADAKLATTVSVVK
jgi:beta-glucosidase